MTAQGIGDALAQGWFVGSALARGDDLDDYPVWRDDRAADFYEWSYQAARFPTSEAAALSYILLFTVIVLTNLYLYLVNRRAQEA